MLRLNEMDYPNDPQALESPHLFVNCRNQAITPIEKWMPSKPELFQSISRPERRFTRFVLGNALVFTEPIRFRMSAIQETIEKRSGKYVGRFWSSPAFFQPTTQPTKSMSYMNFRVLWQSPRSCMLL